MSPYYEDDMVTLHHGDCLDHPDLWTGADVLVTDPPYGISWSHGAIKSSKAPVPKGNLGIQNDQNTAARDQVLKIWGDKPAIVFVSLRAPFPAGMKRILVFGKPKTAGLIGTRLPWFSNWEPIFICGEWPDQTPTRSAVIETRWKAHAGYSGYTTMAGHPHAKPLDVMEQLIDAAPPGCIADPFAGSGTTLEAAMQRGVKSIGIEKEDIHLPLIMQRIERQHAAGDPILPPGDPRDFKEKPKKKTEPTPDPVADTLPLFEEKENS